jgi:hypothetical protein
MVQCGKRHAIADSLIVKGNMAKQELLGEVKNSLRWEGKRILTYDG